ncbi:unnamed protein product [Hanseniaspora opuntiae]
MDFITGLPTTTSGHNAILLICCRFTKRVILLPAKTTWTSADTWNAVYHFVILTHGLINTIVSDRDVRITGKWFREMCESFRIKQLLSTTNHPQTDGQSERTIRTIIESIRASHFGDHSDWDVHLKEAEFAYNTSPHSTIKMTPAFADVGYELGSPDVHLNSALNSRSDNAREHARKLKAIKLQVKDAIEDARVAMQSSNKAASKVEVKPTKTLGEAGLRVKEVLSVVGVSFQHEHVLTKFRDVDPAVTIPVSFEAFLTLGRGRCESLLRNLKNVISHDANPTATNAIDALIKNLH